MPHVLQIAPKSTVEGGEFVLMHLARGLLRRGYRVTVAAPDPGDLLSRMAREGAETAVLPLRHVWDGKAVRRLARFCDEREVDLVQTHGKVLNILARRALPRIGRPVVSIATEHNPLRLARGGFEAGWRNRLKARIYRWLDNRTAPRSARIVCVSDPVRQDKIEQGVDPGRLVVIENGIELDRFAPRPPAERDALRVDLGLPPGSPVVGTVARMDAQKNLGVLLRSMSAVWADCPEAHLIVVGDGTERERLHALARDLDPERARIHLLGYREDVPALLQIMDVFCLTSLWEGQPLAVMEAMASGLPVVCTPVPGSLTLVEDGATGMVVPFDDPEATGKTIARLLGDAPTRRRIGNAAGCRARERCSMETMIDRTARLYAEAGCPPPESGTQGET